MVQLRAQVICLSKAKQRAYTNGTALSMKLNIKILIKKHI